METCVFPRNFMARIYCQTCGADKVAFDKDSSVTAEQLANTAWDTRSSPDVSALQERVRELEEALGWYGEQAAIAKAVQS